MLRVEGWKGRFSKKGQAEVSMTYVDRLISKGGRVDFQIRAQAEMVMMYGVDR